MGLALALGLGSVRFGFGNWQPAYNLAGSEIYLKSMLLVAFFSCPSVAANFFDCCLLHQQQQQRQHKIVATAAGATINIWGILVLL